MGIWLQTINLRRSMPLKSEGLNYTAAEALSLASIKYLIFVYISRKCVMSVIETQH